jgi:hypothetical protein
MFALSTVVAFAFGRFAFTVRFAFTELFALLFALPFPFSFLFLGRFGRFSFALAELLVFRLSLSAGFTVSGVSPSFVARLISIATVCPALTTSPGRGN